MESGLFLDLYDDVLTALLSLVKQNVKVYENLDAYVQERSEDVSPNVKLANVKNLFISLFGALALVLFAFILDRQIWSRKRNKNRRKLLPLKAIKRKPIQKEVRPKKRIPKHLPSKAPQRDSQKKFFIKLSVSITRISDSEILNSNDI